MAEYSSIEYELMIADKERRLAYLAAIKAVAKNARVLDLGCGSGFFSVAAAKYGAKEVYAVEINTAVKILPSILKSNGLQETVKVFLGDIRDIPIGDFDVLISDLRGSLPMYRNGLEIFHYAKSELMNDGANIIPAKDHLYLALVSCAEHSSLIESLNDAIVDVANLDWSHCTNAVCDYIATRGFLKAQDILSNIVKWGAIDYTDDESLLQKSRGGKFRTTCTQDGHADGIALWFDADLDGTNGFSNRPSDRIPIYGRLLCPFRQPLWFQKGETIEIDFSYTRVGNQHISEWGIKSEKYETSQNSLGSLGLGRNDLVAESGAQKTWQQL